MITAISKVRQTFLCGWKHTSLKNRTLNILLDTDIEKLIDNGDMKIIDIYYKYSGEFQTFFGNYNEEELGVDCSWNTFEFVIYLKFPKNNKVFALSLNTQGWKICDNKLKRFIRRKVLIKLLEEMNEDNIFVNDKFDEERQNKEETFLKFAGYRAL